MARFEQLRRFVANEIVDLGVPEGALSPEDMRRTRIISITSLGLCLFAGAPAVVQFLRLGIPLLTSLTLFTLCAALLNLIALRHLRRPWLAAHVGLALLGFQLVVSNVFTGGFYDPNFSWLYVLPLSGAALLDVRGAVIWTALTLAACVSFWLLPGLGIELTSQVPELSREGNALFNRVTAVGALGIIAIGFVAGQRKAERQLASAHREMLSESAYVQILMHAAVAANEAQSFDSAMRDSMQRICDTMDWMAGRVYTVDEDGSSAASEVGYLRDPRVSELERHYARHRQLHDPPTLVLDAVREGQPQILESFEPPDDPDSPSAVARRTGVESAMAVPVFVNGSVPAVMLFASRSRLEHTDRLREVFSLIGVELGKVAERTALQERVHQTQKMEAVGQLAAGVAHEINNPMSYVRTNLHTLRGEWSELRSKLPGEDAQRLSDFEELIDESLEGVERTIAIVRDVKEFSHNGVVDQQEWEEVSLAELLDGALRVAASQAPAEVRIESDHVGSSDCRCAPNQIRQVLVNLIVNAVQALGGSGHIRLTTGREGNEVFARVEDDGPGMNHATRERLFEPFFTTKPVGVGTGLGLSVSYEIVRNHGGSIQVESEPGFGACFEVRLPVTPA